MDRYFCTLPARGLIRITGDDRHSFLQGLITNDAHAAAPDRIIYACMLTPQGKFLHDFFIHDAGDALLLDCEGGDRTEDLLRRLSLYRLRAKVTLSAENNVPVYTIFGESSLGLPDPRHDALGRRSFDKPDDLSEVPFDAPDLGWDYLRIQHTIPDGSRDLVPEKSTMDEANMDQINAISYDKGCYIGQELTARMHYRGLGKRHLRTLPVQDLPEKAEIRSTCGDHAIALVRD